jgi:hypothetical protein
MDSLDGYPFLKAALDDMLLVSELTGRGIGTPRHIISLLHDAVEFILYESLLALDQDIYKNGQNTIGLDAAMAHCKTHGIDLPLLGTIRTIQKHRGDAKHHAQTPHEAAFAKMMGEFRIIASRLVYERFGQVLGSELQELGLLPYHVALYESYRKYRTHNWNLALRFALGALLHKHRAVLGDNDDYSAGTLREPAAILNLLSREVAGASYPPAPLEVLEALKKLPDDVTSLLGKGKIREATEVAGHGYARVDEVLPGVFDIKHARRFTERLVQPEYLLIRRGMAWSKWQRADTPKKHDVGKKLRDLLKQRPDLVKAFGKPHYAEDDDRYWRWWEFAVFDGIRWHTFHLDDHFALSLESGSLSDKDASRREQVAEIVLVEFECAAREYQT